MQHSGMRSDPVVSFVGLNSRHCVPNSKAAMGESDGKLLLARLVRVGAKTTMGHTPCWLRHMLFGLCDIQKNRRDCFVTSTQHQVKNTLPSSVGFSFVPAC